MKLKNSPGLFLFFAILIGFFLRFWKLTELPLPLNGDELAFGYYGWSLLNFGTDEYGNRFPLYFPSIGDYKYPTLAYLNIIPAFFFGLHEITSRFWSAVAGVLLIPITFFISYSIFKSKLSAIITAWLIAISPWSLIYSRMGYESNVAVTLTSAAIALLLYINDKKPRKKVVYLFPILLFLLSIFCYGSQRIFIPLFLIGFCLITLVLKKYYSKLIKYLLITTIVLTFISAVSLIPWESRGRASGVLAFSLSEDDKKFLAESIHWAGIASYQPPLPFIRLINNKITYNAFGFIDRYFDHFSAEFLFLKGGRHPESVPLIGNILLIELPFLMLGLASIFYKRELKALLLIWWILIAPFASALTLGGTNNVRALILFPALSIITAFGISRILDIRTLGIYKKFLIGGIILFISLNGLVGFYQIFFQKPVARPWNIDQGMKEMVNTVWEKKDQYKGVAMMDTPYIFFLYYQQISPSEFQKLAKITDESRKNQWNRVNTLDNIRFKMPYNCPKGGKANVLYVCKGTEVPQNAKIIKSVRFKDQIPAYTILEYLPISTVTEKPVLPQGYFYMVDIENSFPEGLIPESEDRFW